MVNPLDIRAAYADISNAIAGKRSSIAASEPLERLGWLYLSSGCYSSALGKGDLVIKLNFDADGCDAYLTWCMYHRGLPGVPEVYRVWRLEKGYAALMQRYRDFRPDAYREYTSRFTALRNYLYGGAVSEREVDQPYIELAKMLKAEFPNADWDLHEGNFLMGDNGLVLTDPFRDGYRSADDVAIRCSSKRGCSSAGYRIALARTKPHMHLIANAVPDKLRPGRNAPF